MCTKVPPIRYVFFMTKDPDFGLCIPKSGGFLGYQGTHYTITVPLMLILRKEYFSSPKIYIRLGTFVVVSYIKGKNNTWYFFDKVCYSGHSDIFLKLSDDSDKVLKSEIKHPHPVQKILNKNTKK